LVLGLWPVHELVADGGSSGSRPPAGGRVALAYNVDSPEAVDLFMDRAAGAGATILKSPQPAAFGGYHGYFADHDGMWWEVAYNPGLTATADGTVVFG
jgi:uncharacterized glyoxalase superfamily protein PhnB